ncbi:MAG: DUF2092 domain-containing protein [Candidatus Acidiferrum sp.]
MIRSDRVCLLVLFVLAAIFGSVGPVAAQDTSPSTTPKQTTPPAAKKKTTPPKTSAPAPLELEPKAIEILKATSNKLASAHTLTFTAIETFESLSRQGAPLIYANKYDTVLQRPNKLRVILEGDGPASEFYYDGKVVMAYAPTENLVAVADAPDTIDKTLEAVFHSAAIYFPFTDLIVTDPYGDMAPGLKHAYYVGQSNVVAGITTDIVAFAGNGIFAEMWVGADDKLPRVIHVIYLDDPDHLRHNLILSDWKLDASVSDDFFTSSRASSAKHMQFAHPNSGPAPGAKPMPKTPPTKTPAPPKANPTQPQ